MWDEMVCFFVMWCTVWPSSHLRCGARRHRIHFVIRVKNGDIFVMFVKFLGCVSKTMTFATGVKMKLVAKMGVFCHKLCVLFEILFKNVLCEMLIWVRTIFLTLFWNGILSQNYLKSWAFSTTWSASTWCLSSQSWGYADLDKVFVSKNDVAYFWIWRSFCENAIKNKKLGHYILRCFVFGLKHAF